MKGCRTEDVKTIKKVKVKIFNMVTKNSHVAWLEKIVKLHLDRKAKSC